MGKEIYELTLSDFADLFGAAVGDVLKYCGDLISKCNFKYSKPDKGELEKTKSQIIKRIDSGELTVSGKARKNAWEKGWQENLNEFEAKGYYDGGILIPKYIRPNELIRFKRNYILPQDPRFMVHWTDIFRTWVFGKYFREVEAIYEFGCGTGYNLAFLANLFPGKKLRGLDWALSSVKLIELLAKSRSLNLEAKLFDIFEPDEALNFIPGSAVLTFHALEQIGGDFEKFLQFLLVKRPDICVNVEPIYELYDQNNELDCLARRFHKRRNYLDGYLTRLMELEKTGKIAIIEAKRIFFGSMYQDPFSTIVWKIK